MNIKLAEVMEYLSIIKGYAEYELNKDIALSINAHGVLVASDSDEIVFVSLSEDIADVDIITQIVEGLGDK